MVGNQIELTSVDNPLSDVFFCDGKQRRTRGIWYQEKTYNKKDKNHAKVNIGDIRQRTDKCRTKPLSRSEVVGSRVHVHQRLLIHALLLTKFNKEAR